MSLDALKKLKPEHTPNTTPPAEAQGSAILPPTGGAGGGLGIYIPNPELRNEDRIVAPDFPFHVLPERLRRIIDDCHQYLSYSRDFTACGMLAAASIAIARTCKAAYQWDEYATLYLAVVAPPGTGKTHPLLFGLHPIIQANKDAIRQYNKTLRDLAENQTPAPGGLADKQCLFGDFTIESLIKAAVTNKRGISVYMDELGGFFKNFNRYNSGSEQEFWLSNWSGSPYSVTRMGRKYFLEWLCINIVGTIQPSILDELGKGGRAQNGFVERILFCYPEKVNVIKLKRRNQRSDTKHILLRNYIPIIQVLLDKQLAIQGIEDENDEAYEIGFSPEADDIITDYINELKDRMDEHENEYMRNVYSKLQNYAIRFALIINRIRYACEYQDNRDFPPDDDQVIRITDVQHAKDLCEYFLKHALKAHNSISGATPADKLPRDILKWYRSLPIGQELTTRQIEDQAVLHSLSRPTMFRFLNEPDQQKRLFAKIRHGIYERLY